MRWKEPRTNDGVLIDDGMPLYRIKKLWGRSDFRKPYESFYEIVKVVISVYHRNIHQSDSLLVGDDEGVYEPDEYFYEFKLAEAEFKKHYTKEGQPK